MKWEIGKYPSVIVSDTKVQNENFPRLLNPAESPDSDIECYGGYMVCESIGNKQHAHLIAAAPEMYEALKTIENDNNQIPKFLWGMIQNAIRKAEGKLPSTISRHYGLKKGDKVKLPYHKKYDGKIFEIIHCHKLDNNRVRVGIELDINETEAQHIEFDVTAEECIKIN